MVVIKHFLLSSWFLCHRLLPHSRFLVKNTSFIQVAKQIDLSMCSWKWALDTRKDPHTASRLRFPFENRREIDPVSLLICTYLKEACRRGDNKDSAHFQHLTDSRPGLVPWMIIYVVIAASGYCSSRTGVVKTLLRECLQESLKIKVCGKIVHTKSSNKSCRNSC